MARGMEKPPLVVILDAGGHTNLQKIDFSEAVFFSVDFRVEKGVKGPRSEYGEMAGGPLKKPKKHETDCFRKEKE